MPEKKEKVEEKVEADFKVAEIWVKSGQIFIEAPESFWNDRCRALGVVEFCKDIIKTAVVKKEESPIIKPSGDCVQSVNKP